MNPITDAARGALDRPIAEAIGLPGALYTSANFEMEHERLFARRWVPVTVGANLPESGDMMPVEIAGWHLLIVRTREGALKCFHNICRHRAMKLVGEKCSRKRAIQCPWHSWTYDLDGRLLGTPMIGGDDVHKHDSFDAPFLALKEVRSARWLDYLFINIDGTAPDFEEWIRPLSEYFGRFALSGLGHGTTIETPFDGNWKLVVEGAMENYHVPWCHPQLATGERQDDWRHEVLGDCAVSMHYTPGVFKKVGEGGSVHRQNNLPRCPEAPADLANRYYLVTIFPTGIFFVCPTHVVMSLLVPQRWNHTRYIRNLYLFGDGASAPEHKAQREAIFENWRTVGDQDVDLVRNVQAMARVRDAAGIRTRFSPYWERSVHNFQRLYAGALD